MHGFYQQPSAFDVGRRRHTRLHQLPDGALKEDMVEQSTRGTGQGDSASDRRGGHISPIGPLPYIWTRCHTSGSQGRRSLVQKLDNSQEVEISHSNQDEFYRTQTAGDPILVAQETTMTVTINTTDDFLQALRSSPSFHEAARRELLIESLIGLPEEFAGFRAEIYRRTDRIQGHLNNLMGHDVDLNMPSDLRRQVERRFGLTRVRGIWSSKVSIQPPSRTERFSSEVEQAVDSGLIEDSQGGRILDTDMVIMAWCGEMTVYVLAEASGVVNDDDIERVRDSAAFLRLLYPATEAIPAVYGYSIAGPQVRFARADETAGLEQVHIFLDDSIA